MLKDIATLIEALTKAAWPILAFVLISRFHDEVGAILRRLAEFKKGKLFGQEVEMEDSLNRLQLTAQAVEEKVAAIPPEQGVIESTEPAGSETDKYLIEAARSPRAALIMLAAALVREATTASLEWSANQVFARHGFIHPDTSKPTLGWDSAMEFVGRPLDQI